MSFLPPGVLAPGFLRLEMFNPPAGGGYVRGADRGGNRVL